MSGNDEAAESGFTYFFSRRETELLAKHIRRNQLPDGLEKFRDAVYSAVYSAMTISDAEELFRD